MTDHDGVDVHRHVLTDTYGDEAIAYVIDICPGKVYLQVEVESDFDSGELEFTAADARELARVLNELADRSEGLTDHD